MKLFSYVVGFSRAFLFHYVNILSRNPFFAETQTDRLTIMILKRLYFEFSFFFTENRLELSFLNPEIFANKSSLLKKTREQDTQKILNITTSSFHWSTQLISSAFKVLVHFNEFLKSKFPGRQTKCKKSAGTAYKNRGLNFS